MSLEEPLFRARAIRLAQVKEQYTVSDLHIDFAKKY